MSAIVGNSAFFFSLRDTLRDSQEVLFEITTVELMPLSSGRMHYTHSLNVLRAVGVSSCTWTLHGRSVEAMYDVVVTGSDGISISDTSIDAVDVVVSAAEDLGVSFEQNSNVLSATVMSSKSANTDGYAIIRVIPPGNVGQVILPKRFTVVIDRSGSMGTQKMEQAKMGALYCIDRLSPHDEVNVVEFRDVVTSLFISPVQASAGNLELCRDATMRLRSGGGTNITGALTSALSGYRDSSLVNVIILLTDGVATIDFPMLRVANKYSARVYVFGVGSDVNETDIRRLASEHRGQLELVQTTQFVTRQIALLYERIKNPLVKNPSLSFSPNNLYEILPLSIPDIYEGEQLTVAGRYRSAGRIQVTLAETSVIGSVNEVFDVDLANDDTTAAFVPKIDEITLIGTTYGLITQFTRFEQGPKPDNGTTSVEANDGPFSVVALSASPNPVKEYTQLVTFFNQPHADIRLQITDLAGRTVLEIGAGECQTGEWSFKLVARDAMGAFLPSGVYILRISAGDEIRTVTIHVTR